MTESKCIHGFKVYYDENRITVMRAHMLNYSEIPNFCTDLKRMIPFEYRRSEKSWAKELVATNFIYAMKMFESSSVDTDIRDDENPIRLLYYNIIYLIYRWYTRKDKGK